MPEIAQVVDLRVINGGDDIANLKACLGRCSQGVHLNGQDASVHVKIEAGHDTGGHRDRGKSQLRSEHRPAHQHRLNLGISRIDGNRIAYSLRGRGDGHIDSHDAPGQVHQGAAAVAGIDRRVRLN